MTSAETWNGKAWRTQSTPNPAGAAVSELRGVSCSSATACIAVGWYYQYGVGPVPYLTLAEVWNGSAWSVQSTPNPAGATISTLQGVSCSSATACTAVGYYRNNSGADMTLAETWNGTAWAIQSTPNPAGATSSGLGGVSCSSATACTAVGSAGSVGADVTLAETWNGAAWAVQTTPNPPGAYSSVLSGVSCRSAFQTTPNPPDTTYANELDAVSCRSATACTAVGFNQGTGLILAEVWNGTAWSIQTIPSPPGSNTAQLDGVSCRPSTCTAVGSYVDALRIGHTLAEAEHG